MFFVGLGIVLVYTFFLIGIISKQNKAVKKQTPLEVDVPVSYTHLTLPTT